MSDRRFGDEMGEVRQRVPPVVPPKPPIDTVRYSMNNLKESSDMELNALLEELMALETQLNGDGDQLLLGIPTIPQSHSSERIKPKGSGPVKPPSVPVEPVRVEVIEQPRQVVPPPCASSCSSPDGDSAFGDASSTESHRFHGSHVSSADSCRDSLNTPSPTQVSPQQNLSVEELKAQKIREALEKMKEAKITRIFVKFFVEDGAPLQMLIDERWSVSETMRQLAEKHNMTLHEDHCIVEEFPDLLIRRIYEDHENLVENIQMWMHESPNKLWFMRRSDKYPFVDKPENYLVTERTKDIMDVPNGENWPRDVKQQFVRDYFARDPVVPPELEGWLLLKADGRKSWKKQFFTLRPSGLYNSPKGKKTSKDLQCLMNLHSYQVYSGFEWKKKYKAPTEWCICIKLTALQIKRSSYIKYICCEDEATFRRWIAALRIAKNGADLYSNWLSAVARRREVLDAMAGGALSRAESTISTQAIGLSARAGHGSNVELRYPSNKIINHTTTSPSTSSMQSQPSTSFSSTTPSSSTSATTTPTPEHRSHSRTLFESDEMTGTIKRAPEHLLRRATSHSSGGAPSMGTPEDEADSDEESFPAPPPAISATYTPMPSISVQKRASNGGQVEARPTSAPRAVVSPVPPPKPLFPPPLAMETKPSPPVRQTPALNLTPLAKKAPPPPPKRSDATRVQTVAGQVQQPQPTPHMNELEAALGRRRERIEGL
ncbi:unnamed protein product, partial [Mesorhabditis belari]|uniref:Uncharacterized protein n=1 Tax=Mesorhabditis belari TaxID=2138241 RepID=A0AAF3EBF2_9BILA